MKKIIVFLLIFLMAFPVVLAYASQYVKITESTIVTVAEVVDGDALIVKNPMTGLLSLVRLLGVDAGGNTAALTYMTTRLLGKTVTLTTDYAAPYDARWSYVYVSDGGDVNGDLIRLGLAKADRLKSTISKYAAFVNAENNAKKDGLGVWESEAAKSSSGAAIGDKPTNINTASAVQLEERLGVSASVARNIISYRSGNPFNDIYEIRFVPGFTNSMFEYCEYNLVVSTNINTAGAGELGTLSGITSTMVTKIIEAREINSFKSVSELLGLSIMSRNVYNLNYDFIATYNRAKINARVDDIVVNINTASISQLCQTGISGRDAERIISLRGDFLFRSLEELYYAEGGFTQTFINEYGDNMNFITDINSASEDELLSLFGNNSNRTSYVSVILDKRPFSGFTEMISAIGMSNPGGLADAVCFGKSVDSAVNIRIASYSELIKLGIDDSTAQRIVDNRGYYTTPADIPKALIGIRANITLYTNINTASYEELIKLSRNMTQRLASEIIFRRSRQSLAYMSEISDMCRDLDISDVSRSLNGLIVFR